MCLRRFDFVLNDFRQTPQRTLDSTPSPAAETAACCAENTDTRFRSMRWPTATGSFVFSRSPLCREEGRLRGCPPVGVAESTPNACRLPAPTLWGMGVPGGSNLRAFTRKLKYASKTP